MKRRQFLRQISATTFLVGSGISSAWAMQAPADTHLTILHTNDWHSRIEPFPQDGGRNAGLGGAARRAALLEEIRANTEHVLLLDSGDIFQGTPYFNFYGGELEFKLMSAMGYDAATVGNHDFDAGIEGLASQLPHANFPFINCNYQWANTPMAGKVKPYLVFKKGPIRIGITGIGIELNGLVPQALYGDTLYVDPIEPVTRIARHLKEEERCDLVICLSHLGYRYREDKVSDVILARESRYLDIILGGHTHTFMDEPDIVRNQDDLPVLINQVGWAGILLGRIDVSFSRATGERCITCHNSWINPG